MAEPHTLTFLFTDVEGCTFQERNPKAISEALVRHNEILRTAIDAHDVRGCYRLRARRCRLISMLLEQFALGALTSQCRGYPWYSRRRWA
jgi:class 3 adenylate cyclase